MSMEPTGQAPAAPRDPAARAARLLEQLRHSRTLWSLRNADGWVMMEERGTPGLPVWPSDAEAAASARGDWVDCAPAAIPLDEWRDRWLPGLGRDGVRIVLWPVAARAAVIVTAEEHAQHLATALALEA